MRPGAIGRALQTRSVLHRSLARRRWNGRAPSTARGVKAGAEVVRYDGADHGWAQDPTRDNYREADATDAWARAEAFLEG